MTDWFAIINIKNILLLTIGFVVGYYYRMAKIIIKKLKEQDG